MKKIALLFLMASAIYAFNPIYSLDMDPPSGCVKKTSSVKCADMNHVGGGYIYDIVGKRMLNYFPANEGNTKEVAIVYSCSGFVRTPASYNLDMAGNGTTDVPADVEHTYEAELANGMFSLVCGTLTPITTYSCHKNGKWVRVVNYDEVGIESSRNVLDTSNPNFCKTFFQNAFK